MCICTPEQSKTCTYRHGCAADAAKILARRMNAKQRYRRRRDRKIAVDWLGKEFEFTYRNMETGKVDNFRFRVVRYNSENHTVALQSTDGRGYNVWDTDSFWFLLKRGELLPC